MIYRDYQTYAIDSIFHYFRTNRSGNPIVAAPTGTGKSVIIAGFIQQALQMYPETRVMKLTHVREIIEQNFAKLLSVWPQAPAGIYSAGLKRKDLGYPILFGGIGTVARADPETFGRIDLLLIDECHLLSPSDTTMYQVVISALKEINPSLRVVGFTATPYRLGHGMLTDEGGIFTDFCANMTDRSTFNWFIDQGYLSPLIPKRTSLQLDVSDVHVRGGEYKQDELQAAVDKDEITGEAVREIIECGQDRNKWLLFASGIEHTIHVANAMTRFGIPTTFVHSKMKSKERDQNVIDFQLGKYRAMVNNGILTTGFDCPEIDLIGVLRPTESASLWVQLLGRGTRPVYTNGFDLSSTEGRLAAIAAGPKQNCLVLDFAGNTQRLGPINDPVLPRRKGKGGGGVAPIRLCEVCNTYIHASLTVCPHCGNEFPREIRINRTAGTDELIAKEELKVEVFKVDRVTYARHEKQGRPPTMKVSYFCGLRLFKEYVCLEHEGFAAKKARDWWRCRAVGEVPATIDEAFAHLELLKEPSHVRIWLKHPYPEVLACDFTGSAFGESQ